MQFDEHVLSLKKDYKNKELRISRQERDPTNDDQSGGDLIIEEVQETDQDIVGEYNEDDLSYGKANQPQKSMSGSHQYNLGPRSIALLAQSIITDDIPTLRDAMTRGGAEEWENAIKR